MNGINGKANLSIDFLVVGGGIGGLACAIALRRVGHRVTVLEKTRDEDVAQMSHGGIRLPPNVAKILIHWGLGEQLKQIAVTSEAIELEIYETGYLLGVHVWDEEFLKETGGSYIFCHHVDLRRLLFETAVSLGAEIRGGANVVSVDGDDCHVKLSTGETLRADVIVGADGRSSLIQREIVGYDVYASTPCSSLLYNTTVPGPLIRADPELSMFYKKPYTKLFVWFGNGRSAMGYPIGGKDEFALHFWVPPSSGEDEPDHWGSEIDMSEMRRQLGECEPRLVKLVSMGSPPVRVPTKNVPPIEDWVHDEGRMVMIGEAAHPLPAGSIQGAALAVEDAAVLAKLFSHLISEDQIPSFLYAFQDLREGRCASVIASEQGNLTFQMMPKCEQQEQRDKHMRAKYDAGESPLAGGDAAEQWEMLKELFGYDAEDEADDWWVKWGVLRERAKQRAMDNDMEAQMNGLVMCH
ncbi:FAD/NAD(P)-binding domain-containing protein [Leucogyrophana mollusca]|uniref:FAD/NAD(P)-binding domain-containing protein n=1 Tax=Leucogyrophana mollusca TaxID=85980 RepID=A0ACB8AXI7_9AGAM|nr:FAD/NAD(P)-binding domain-containing protein [Leucogyrophana mollusca]